MSHENMIEASPNDPIEVDRFAWPVATLDPVAKMRALAAGLPHCAVGETILDAEFGRVWNLITDFENGTPRYEGFVSEVEILAKRVRTPHQVSHDHGILDPGRSSPRTRLVPHEFLGGADRNGRSS